MSTMSEEKKQFTPDEFIAANESKVNKRWYPRFHIAPRVGWCNDPNGFAFFGGQYHSSTSTIRTSPSGGRCTGHM